MQQNTHLTKEQFVKLACDAHACLELALIAEARINESQDHPMSMPTVSRTTAMMTVLGLGIELKLKALYYKTTSSVHPNTHALVTVYDSLDANIKSQLTDIFNEWTSTFPEGSKLGVASIRSKTVPNSPGNNLQFTGFRGILEFFDHVGLYSRRYSFEDFSYNGWWQVIYPRTLAPLMKKVTEFTNNLADPVFRQDNETHL